MRVVKAAKFLALGIVFYPLCYAVLNFLLPIVIGAVGDENSPIILMAEVVTWFVLPFFSVFYVLAFHQLAFLFERWQKVTGYILVTMAVAIEIVLPWLDKGIASSVMSFVAHISELMVLSLVILLVSHQMKHKLRDEF